jgi:hypothetical protein
MNNPNRKLSELALTHGNPRTQSAEGGRLLADQIDCFGPLDGIVYNRRTKELVGGNMRSVRFRQCEDPEIVIDETYPKASKTGTVAMGHVMVDGERWTYREVDWPKPTNTRPPSLPPTTPEPPTTLTPLRNLPQT